MPFRDHFHPPVSLQASWEGLHAQWPARMILELRSTLPPGFVAEPSIHLGAQLEVDVAAYEKVELDLGSNLNPSPDGGTATVTEAPPQASLEVETEFPELDEYAVRIFDVQRRRRLVATIEIVSPANKDRPAKRNAFIAKCSALLQKGIAVCIIDLVTTRPINLYTEILTFIGHSDPSLGTPPPGTYTAACRWVERNERTFLEAWSFPLIVGQPLPTLPLWLTETRFIPLNLETTYEQACHDLWFT